jgi:hypothetical protein
MNISVGSMIRWNSAAGVLSGKVDSIVLDLNGAGETIPWMMIRNISPVKHSAVRMCASDGYLKQMKVELV